MADILIRGMEMPKYTTKAEFGIDADGNPLCMVHHRDGTEPGIYDVVPLPEGHGRLIDGHKLYRALFATECGNIAADRDSEGWPKVLTYEAVKKAIQDATIIVPAEGVSENG